MVFYWLNTFTMDFKTKAEFLNFELSCIMMGHMLFIKWRLHAIYKVKLLSYLWYDPGLFKVNNTLLLFLTRKSCECFFPLCLCLNTASIFSTVVYQMNCFYIR